MKKKLISILGALCAAVMLLPSGAAMAAVSDPLTPSDIVVPGVATLSKTAVRTAADEWEVTLKVTAKRAIRPQEIEIVLLVDTSGSMAWCTEQEHKHDSDCYELTCTQTHKHCFDAQLAAAGTVNEHNCYTLSCKLTQHSHAQGGQLCSGTQLADTRQYAAAQSARALLDGLWTAGVPFSASVVTFAGMPVYAHGGGVSGYTDTASVKAAMTAADSEQVLAALKAAVSSSGASGATCLKQGLELAEKQFSSSECEKILVVLSDGEYDGESPVQTAATIKQAGITIYSVGFLYGDSTMQQIASSGCYSTAGSSAALTKIFAQINTKLNAMIIDKPGENLTIIESSITTQGHSGTVTMLDGTLYWNSPTPIPANQSVTIKYTVKLKSIGLGDNNGVFDGVALNEYAKLVYSAGHGCTSQAYFPVPKAHYEVGMLTTLYAGLPAAVTPAETVQYRITDFAVVYFDTPVPAAEIVNEGDVYLYCGSLLELNGLPAEEITVSGSTAVAAVTGVSALTHNYCREYTVCYEDGVADEVIVVPPCENAAAGSEYTVSSAVPVRSGYIFDGWKYGARKYDPSASFIMPEDNVTLTAQWKADIPSTGDGALFYVLFTAMLAAAAAGIWLFVKIRKSM